MFQVVKNNDLRVLAEELAKELAEKADNPLQPVTVVVPGRAMADWLRLRLADHNGICANVRNINRLARELLDRKRAVYHGLPIMITRNDHTLKLYNGDVGVLLKDADGNLKAWFPAGVSHGETGAEEKKYRSLPIARLPEYSDVYAMTIHKSQGSEADKVAVILPARESKIMTRELLYTGITRAKKRVYIRGSESVISSTVKKRTSRISGLSERLQKCF